MEFSMFYWLKPCCTAFHSTQQLAAQEKAKYRMATETVKVIPATTCKKILALTAVTLAIVIGQWGWEKIITFTQYPTVIWIHCFSNNKMKTFNMLQSNLLFLFVAMFTLLSQCISWEFEHMCCIEDYVNIPISVVRMLLKWMHVFNAKWLIKHLMKNWSMVHHIAYYWRYTHINFDAAY